MSSRGVAIVGATATGKTALASSLARKLGDTELVSVDAMAVYRGFDIGTAKPTAADRAGLLWHLVDVADPDEEFSVARFQTLAADALAQIAGRAHRAFLVGGTGLYHRAIIDKLEIPGRYPVIAAQLERRARTEGLEPLYAELQALDPDAAQKIEPCNARRVLRALEVGVGSGRPFSSFGPGLRTYGPARYHLVGLDLPRDELGARIESRLDEQLKSGFVGEVRALLARPEGISRTARQALGYRELIQHLELGVSFDETRAEIVRRTKNFARRQLAWFRRDPRIRWFDARHDDLDEAVLEFVGTCDTTFVPSMGD